MASKTIDSRVVNLTLVQAPDGSLQPGGSYAGQLLYDMPDLSARVREPFSQDLSALYNRLPAQDRMQADTALLRLVRVLDTLVKADLGT